MSRFADLLQATLRGVNDAFDTDRTDLRGLVEELDRAAKSVNPDLAVTLVERDKSPDGTTYALVVSKYRGHADRIMFYHLSPNGYPIAYSTSEGDFIPTGEVLNRAGLARHFEEMLTNRTSPLVTAFAYLIR